MTEPMPEALCLKWHRGELIRRWLTRDRALLWCRVCDTFR